MNLQRQNRSLARKKATEQAHTCRGRAEQITDEVFALIDERADLLGKDKLSVGAKIEILRVFNGVKLLTKAEFDDRMRTETLATRKKVLEAMTIAVQDLRQPDEVTTLRAEIEGLRSHKRELELSRDMWKEWCRTEEFWAYMIKTICMTLVFIAAFGCCLAWVGMLGPVIEQQLLVEPYFHTLRASTNAFPYSHGSAFRQPERTPSPQ